MKQSFLFRLFAIAFFCLTSFAIKSETSACKSKCNSFEKNHALSRAIIINEQHAIPGYPYEDFFIKI